MRDGWQRVPLGDTYTLIQERVEDPRTASGLRYVGMEHIDVGAPLRRWGDPTSVTSAKTRFSKDDVLFGRLRPYLRKVARAPWDGLASTEILVLRARTDCCLPGMLHLLIGSEHVLQLAIQQSAGSRMPRTSARDLAQMAVSLPPLDEQRRIVDLVGSLDATIAATDQAVAKAEQARRAILADLLFATNVASLSSGRQLNRQTWRLESLGDVAGVVRGLSWSKDEERAAPGAGLIPVLRIGNVQVDGIDASDTLYVPTPASRTASKVLIGQSTIIMVGSNGNPARVGNAHRATQEINGYGFASFLIGVTPFRHVDSRFVLCVLQSDRVQSEITAATSGSTGLKNISLSWLRSLVIPVPPIEDQRFIAEVAEDVDAEVNALRVAARATRGMRRSLLAELLSGKHEIPASYDRLLEAA